MAEHTPGPWEVSDTSIVTKMAPDVCIAVIEDDGEYAAPRNVREANARLIAAAPSLLAALKALLDADVYADGEGMAYIRDSDTEDGKHAVEMAKAAIVEATERGQS
jgi:hypothetical protein